MEEEKAEEKKDIREMLCSLPDRALDAAMFPLIRKWDDPPTALQILEVLDLCIHGSLCADFIVRTLQALYDGALKREGLKHEDLLEKATWRGGRHAGHSG